MNHFTVAHLPLKLFGLFDNSLSIQLSERKLIYSDNGQKQVIIEHERTEQSYHAWWEKIYDCLQTDHFTTGKQYMRTCYAAMEDEICDVNYYLMNWRSWNAESKRIATSRILKGLDQGSIAHGIWGDPAIFMASEFQLEEITLKLLEKGADINTINTVNTLSKLFQTPASYLVLNHRADDKHITWLHKLLDWGATPGLTAEIILDAVLNTNNGYSIYKSDLLSFMNVLETHPGFDAGDNFKRWKGQL